MRFATAAAALGVAVALGTTGCGAGQISQTANQLPAVNGANANYLSLTLRNVQIVYPTDKADEVFGAGGPFKLSFVIGTTSPTDYFRLKEIKAPSGGTVTLVPSSGPQLEITPDRELRSGTPVGLENEAVERATEENRIDATLNGAGKSVAAGLTTNLVFVFEHKQADGSWRDAGETSVLTPVDTQPEYPRQGAAYSAEPPPGEHAEGEHGSGEHTTGEQGAGEHEGGH
ncbi:hypothetical protein Gbro_0969 [Gordonia bronchialis DSM 43247]|uniref:Lipoprotein n=1 Tax=Gordonia bronchialis (strain ATCC 25592 / DSM 43247 / BCRC 13721 / JCM 3198 / KCTC 3076 / NBRC 16047 / NCTC 10667) TaxID=526226 RepID=D0L456_GORB4|nr:hypothetical protein [Gordonia bronchialis]ACY20280.1 hypothetical protein Gbro_0969 [Gordonia bronchialis DSM 43247]MCC3323053.1 hypothetical protein [Gordonia bronchialis]QGS25904.1 hypothetical protein FOB84_19010 [Gordonia bronchialis]UAK37697.1 hypothetical protein K8O93_21865 [Gordonia bronchialis]STQ63083.1 Uncharacterised protein [Gordonia bronchialis]